MIQGYLNKMKSELNGHDPLVDAKRYRYSYYNPKGEAYISLVVEYNNGNVWLHRYKFNSNMFVGNTIDHTIQVNPTSESVNKELKKSAYVMGTGIRKYIEL